MAVKDIDTKTLNYIGKRLEGDGLIFRDNQLHGVFIIDLGTIEDIEDPEKTITAEQQAQIAKQPNTIIKTVINGSIYY